MSLVLVSIIRNGCIYIMNILNEDLQLSHNNVTKEDRLAYERAIQEITELQILLENAHRKARHFAHRLFGHSNNETNLKKQMY